MPSNDREDNAPETAPTADPGAPSALPSGARDGGGSHSTGTDAGASVTAKITVTAGDASDADISSAVGADQGTPSQAERVDGATTTTRATTSLTEQASGSEEGLSPAFPTTPQTPLTSLPGKRSGPSGPSAVDGAGNTRTLADERSEVAGVPDGTPGVAASDGHVAAQRVAEITGKAGEEDKVPPGAARTDAEPCSVDENKAAGVEQQEGNGTGPSIADDGNAEPGEQEKEVATAGTSEGSKTNGPGPSASSDAKPKEGDDGGPGHQKTVIAAASSSEAPTEESSTTPSTKSHVGEKATTTEQTTEAPPADDDQATGAKATTEEPAARAAPTGTPVATPRKPRLGGRGAPPQTPTPAPAPSRWVSMSERPRSVSQTMAMAMSRDAGDVAGVSDHDAGPSTSITTASPAVGNDDDDEWVAFVRAQLVRLFPDFHKYAGGAGSISDGGSERADDDSDDTNDDAPAPATRSFRAELAALRDEIAQLRGVVGEVAGNGYAYETYTDADVADVADIGTDVEADAGASAEVETEAEVEVDSVTPGDTVRAGTPPLPESVASTPLPSSAFTLSAQSVPDSAGPDTNSAATGVAGLTAETIHAALNVVRLLDARGGEPRPDSQVFAADNLQALAELARTAQSPPTPPNTKFFYF